MSKSEDLHLNGKIPYSYRKMDHSSELPDNIDGKMMSHIPPLMSKVSKCYLIHSKMHCKQ